MAGGKETPRQKMIGMMYLVLTALLALQVNSAILLKFKFIDDSLMNVNQKTSKAADGAITGIQEAVKKNENQKKDLAVLEQSRDIRKKTKEMMAYLGTVRDRLIKASGNTANEFKNMSAEDKVAETMLGGKKNGIAYTELKPKLNEYSDYIRKFVPDATPLALDAKQDPRVTEKEQKNKNFAELNFENTPVVAALATISQKETEILKYEADALSALARQVGAETIVFDKIDAFASAESKTVAAGTKYKAELFMTASASSLSPKMTANGSPIPVGPDGRGKVEFIARPGNFGADGNAKASWTGTITIKKGGRDTTFKKTIDYIVSKPVMQIQSASVQALYFKCGNELSVAVPALGADYKPSFSASGAQVLTGAKVGDVTLVPNTKQVTLNVSSNGNPIGKQTFEVRLIPKPDIECYVGGRLVNEKQGTPGTAVRNMTMKAIPDA